MLMSEQANVQEPNFKLTVLPSKSEQSLYFLCSKITSQAYQTSKEIYLRSSAVRTVSFVALITI